MSDAVRQLMAAVSDRSSSLKDEINTATNGEGELEQKQILALQFNIGQYNALLEAASSIAKGTTDMLKTLAQRTS
ncbi:MAG: type III secretion protein [Candidatus Accumulibacter sp.]|nr:type III secretion protein [Accumulibacter sp.]